MEVPKPSLLICVSATAELPLFLGIVAFDRAGLEQQIPHRCRAILVRKCHHFDEWMDVAA